MNKEDGLDSIRRKLTGIIAPVDRNENSSLGSSTHEEAVDKVIELLTALLDRIEREVIREQWPSIARFNTTDEIRYQAKAELKGEELAALNAIRKEVENANNNSKR